MAKGRRKLGSYAAVQPGSCASWPALPLPLFALLALPLLGWLPLPALFQVLLSSGALLLPGAASTQASGQWHTVRAARSGSSGRRCCSSWRRCACCSSPPPGGSCCIAAAAGPHAKLQRQDSERLLSKPILGTGSAAADSKGRIQMNSAYKPGQAEALPLTSCGSTARLAAPPGWQHLSPPQRLPAAAAPTAGG